MTLNEYNLDYSQISDFALRPMECASLLAPSKAVASYRTPKKNAAQEQKKIFGEFVNHAGQMSLTGQNLDCSQILDDAPQLQAFHKK